MKTKSLLPPWPTGIPRVMRPLARFNPLAAVDPVQTARGLDQRAEAHARLLRRKHEDLQCSNLTGTWTEMIYSNRADFNAAANSSAEIGLLSGQNLQPALPAFFFDGMKAFGKGISVIAQGVFSNTSTPTIIFQCRLGTTAGASQFGGASVGVSAAITTGSGVTNKWWGLRLDLTCYTPGQGTNNTTLSGAGYVMSPGGFASPFQYPLEPTTPDTATWTQTLDNTLTQYFNLSVTWSAASASNTITCKQLWMHGWN